MVLEVPIKQIDKKVHRIPSFMCSFEQTISQLIMSTKTTKFSFIVEIRCQTESFHRILSKPFDSLVH